MHRILATLIKTVFVPLLATAIPYLQYSHAQNIKVVKNTKIYTRQVQQDSTQNMIEIRKLLPDAQFDIRYATPNNFTKEILYSSGYSTFLRLPAAYALRNVAQELKQLGLGIKIFDAYRPYSVTQKMWDLIGDERYVANPAKGSGHNRGLAVDLTLIDLASGKELNMGTAYDNFTDTAHHSFAALTESILNNRTLLKHTMEKHGFKALQTEWWHYSWPNNRNYEVLDIPFKKLSNLSR